MGTELISIHGKLNSLLQSKKDALPTDFNQTRFLQNCMTVLQDVKDIHLADQMTVARTMLKGAFLGLDFFNKECYCIIYKGKAQFQTDYKGEKKIVQKHSIKPLKEIYAKIVQQDDVFDINISDGVQTINFSPLPFNNGDIVGAFAVVRYEDDTLQYETMSVKDIENIRDTFSKMPKGQAWLNSFGEMCKKTVFRRLTKNIEIDFKSIVKQEAYQDGADADFNKQPVQIQKPQPINAEFETVKEEVKEEEPQTQEPGKEETVPTDPEAKISQNKVTSICIKMKENNVSDIACKGMLMSGYGYKSRKEILEKDYEKICQEIIDLGKFSKDHKKDA